MPTSNRAVLTLVDLLRERAQERAALPAYTFLADGEQEGARLTYGELDLCARAIAARLQEAGAAGARALLLYPPGLDFVAAFFGCLYAGAVAVPAYPPRVARTQPRLRSIAQDARPRFVLTTAELAAQAKVLSAQVPELQGACWLATDALTPADGQGWAPPAVGPDTLAFLQYTSGSTAAPKGTMVSHGNLLHNEEMIRRAFGQSEESVIVGWLPLYHDMGLIGNVLQPLYVGARCVLMSPVAFLQRPLRWLAAISRHGATTSGGPNFAYDLCVRRIAERDREGLDLSRWKLAYNGSEPVRAETLERFAEAFGPNGFDRRAFYPCYGLAEATLFVSGGVAGAGPVVQPVSAAELEQGRVAVGQRALVGCGRPWSEQTVLIADPATGEPCAPDRVGEIWVAGASIAQGYWNLPEATATAFQARAADGSGPYLRTGDLGFLHEGELFVTGRLKDLIIVRGRNLYPQDLELTAERSHGALRPGCGAAFAVDDEGGERLVLVHELERDSGSAVEEVAATVRQAVAAEHEVLAWEVVFLAHGSLPKTSSGKIQRQACKQLYLSGGLEAVGRSRLEEREAAPLPEASELPAEDRLALLETYLAPRLAAALRLGAGHLDRDQPLTSFGLDSLAAVEIQSRLEEDLGVSVGVGDLLQGPTLAQLAAALLDRLSGESRPATDEEPLEPRGEMAVSPLSHGQRALWFLQRLQPSGSAYNIAAAVRVVAGLDPAALRRAFELLADRHEALRFAFEETPAGPVQRALPERRPEWLEEDASGWSAERLSARLHELAHRPFDLAQDPLLRVAVFRTAPEEHAVLLVVHHIVADLASLAVLVRDLGVLYPRLRLPEARLRYTDWIDWQDRRLAGEAGERLWAWWRESLAGDLPVAGLPADFPRPPLQTFRGGSRSRRLAPAILDGLRAQGATLHATLLALFAALLHRYSGQSEILVGSPTAGRGAAGLADLVGYFVNPVVLRADLAGRPSFRELLERARGTALGAFLHQDYPFPLLVERLQPQRDPSRSPLFQVMLVLERSHLSEVGDLGAFALGEEGARLALAGLEVESLALEHRAAQLDLELAAAEADGGLGLVLIYNADLFEPGTADRLLGHLEVLAAAAVADPARRISELPLLTDAEQRQLLDWNGTAVPFPLDRSLPELFAEQAERTPGDLAAVCEGQELTYGELHDRARRMARGLLEAGLRPEQPVAVWAERGLDFLAALLGILQAGGAYLPLDPRQPERRLAAMVRQSGAPFVLVSEPFRDACAAALADGPGLLSLEELLAGPAGARDRRVLPGQLAYVLYTSGSTGAPKGAMLEHRGMVNHLFAKIRDLDLTAADRVAQTAAPTFDISVWQFLAALLAGGVVEILPDEIAADPARLLVEVKRRGITILETVPSLMRAVLQESAPDLSALRWLIPTGEALAPDLARQWHEQYPEVPLLNAYGPTECSDDVTHHALREPLPEGAATTPIGRPVANLLLHVVDRDFHLLPVGVPGELCVAGVGVGRGYLGDPARTAEVFVPDPWPAEPGGRLYRTGDLGRRRLDSALEFLGRLDHQVKVRGFRIELGEIEAALAEHPGVDQAVVAARPVGGEARLAAWWTGGAAAGELRDFLRQRLPEAMIPSAFVHLEALPLNRNGKVDRKALPEPDWSEPEAAAGVAPRDEIEELLAGIVADVLGRSRVGIAESFFDAGGHSLLATRVVARVRQALGVELALTAFFEEPTVAGLAARVRSAQGPALAPPRRAARTGDLPLSFGQQRLWFLQKLEPESPAYNMPGAVRFRGGLRPDLLREALRAVVRRHEALRTVFREQDGEPRQEILADPEVSLPVLDLSHLPAVERDRHAARLAAEEARQPFDLGAWPLFRATLLRLGNDDHLLVVNLHHVISDGWSQGVLVRELSAVYGGEDLAELPLQYVDYARWQRKELEETLREQLAWWRERLGGAQPSLELPLDRPRPLRQTWRGARRTLRLGPDLAEGLWQVARGESVTPFMALLALFETLLHRWSGQARFNVGTPMANRRFAELEGLIGFFVNTLVLPADLEGSPSFSELLARVREVALGAYAHQDLPFERLVEELQPARELSRTPLFQVLFVLQNAPLGRLALPGLAVTVAELDSGTAKFDLTLSLEETEDGLDGWIEHNTDLFDGPTVERFAAHLATLLRSALAEPRQPIADLPLLAPAERQALVLEWNDTAEVYPEVCVHQLVEAQVARTPDAVAVSFEGQTFTFRQINARANQLARTLRRMGVGPDIPVGLCVERSPDLVVGALAILKSGGGYLPLDPSYPRERLSQMLVDALAGVPEPVVLAHEKLTGLLPEDARVLCLDTGWDQVAGEDDADLPNLTLPDNVCFFIFTSGSTGRPKGSANTHRGTANRLIWGQRSFTPLTAADRFLQKTPFSFDVSVYEIFWPLLSGARMVLARPGGHQDGAYLARTIAEQGVTFMQFVPSMIPAFLDAPGVERCRSLKRVICSGEALPQALAERFWAVLPQVEIFNLYGPSETAIEVSLGAGERGSFRASVPMGRPVANTVLRVLDSRLRPVPVGVPGELFIGGAQVARGYVGRPDLTAERFVPDPYARGERLYRTGDLARYLPGVPSGEIEFLGRIDHQVKVRGCRVELGEIEAALDRHFAVARSVVGVHGEGEDRRLVAHLLLRPGAAAPGVPELRVFLQASLPVYMVPSAFVPLAELPLTPSGKVDRKALPPPAAADSALAVEDSRNELERTLAAIWCEVLGVPRVGFEDNFFDLGGHSLLLTRVQARLRDRLGREVSLVELLTHTTVRALARYLEPGVEPGVETAPAPAVRVAGARRPDGDAIAIVGLSGRFPGAAGVEQLWANLCAGVASIARFSDEELQAAGVDPALRRDPRYVPAAGALDGVELFDAGFFGYSPREAEILDPQHRLFLECAWEALEDAGYDSRRVPGPVGVFASLGLNIYLHQVLSGLDLAEVGEYQVLIGNDKDFLPTRVSYELDLKGPSMAVQTACSSSLVAVHLACQNLLLGACDMALAGGISIALPQRAGYLYEEGGILSPDGCCRAFDAEARGTVRGSGAGIVVLKRLADALAQGDSIRAVIRGSAVNNDGSGKAGYTAPSVEGQDEVITLALAAAGIDPATVSYVEAHGTATPLGDPIEVQALARAFARGGPRERSCALGSIKSNLGHLDAAAGVAGLIKATLALQHGLLPPSLGFSRPNPHIDFAAGPFHVQTGLAEWERGATPRRAGVSSFGIGGTNAHVVLEEPPETGRTRTNTDDHGPASPCSSVLVRVRPFHLFVLSARTPAALERKRAELAGHLARHPGIHPADAAYTLQLGRRAFPERCFAVGRDAADAAAVLRGQSPGRLFSRTAPESAPPVVFLFPGQGSQWPGMGAGLYRAEPAFRREIDRGCEILLPDLGFDLRELLLAPAESEDDARRLEDTQVTQPALFVIEHALARLWMEWGVRPQALIGHSTGELAAACLAGVFALEDALGLVAARGRLVAALPPGAMLALSLPEPEAARRAEEHGLALAAVNSAASSVLSGPREAVEQLAGQLAAEGVEHRRLRTSHAFHSAVLEPVLERFRDEVARRDRRPPSLPWISNVSGTWIRPDEATDPEYWARHLRATVRFAEGVEELLRVPGRVYLEVGPGRSLSSLVRRSPGRSDERTVLTTLLHTRKPEDGVRQVYEALGHLWLAGVEIDWPAVHAHERRRRVPLPAYPFERRRFWVETRHAPQAHLPERRPRPADWLYTPSWRQLPVPPPPQAGAETRRWLLLQDRHGVGEALQRRLDAAGVPAIPVVIGETFRELEGNGFEIDPGDAASWARLVATLAARGELPGTAVHLAGVDGEGAPSDPERARVLAFDSLLYLAQAVGLLERSEPLRIAMVTTHLQAVTGEERLVPEKATLLGACAVLPQEYPALSCRSIDLPPVAGPAAAAALADLLWAELGSGREDRVVAYRGGRRWVRHFEPLSLPEADGAGTRLREGGVYLITGGLGGIGLVLAERLARRVGARLVLVGRSDVPPREEWDRLAALPAVEGEAGWKSARLREVEAAGGELLLLRGDVADPEQARRVVAAARARFGRIDGVVHAAGVFPGGLAQLKTREMVDAIFAPKLAGTRCLAAALADDPPDFFLLCSSLTGIVGAFGLADHAAANAFLDAYAQAGGLAPRAFTLAVDWDAWLEVGQAARGARSLGLDAEPELPAAAAVPVGHPLLDTRSVAPDGQVVFQSRLSTATHWVVDEHRLFGDGLLPGTAYLEMVRAAVEHRAGPGPVEVRNLVFAQPLLVRDGEVREVRVALAAAGDDVRILSRSMAGGPWQEHARCQARLLAGAMARRHDLAEIRGRCAELGIDTARAEGPLRFGPRWQGLFESVHLGQREGLALLRLAPELAADLDGLALHPALLDDATAFALALAEGTFLPMVFERAVVLAPLPAEIASHMRLQGEPSAEILRCDVTVMDRGGAELLRVEGFTLKRLREDAVPAPAAGDDPFETLGEGLTPQEGADLFERLLSTAVTSPQVVVSLRDLDRLLEFAATVDRDRLLQHDERRGGRRGLHPRPDLGVAYVEPRSELEARLAGIWGATLGLDQVGVHDNFFDLGGDSLMAIRLVSLVGRELGAELSLQTLFEAPTVADLASAVETAGSPAAQARVSSPFELLTEAERAALPADVEDAFPMSVLQLGMLFHSDDAGGGLYHLVSTVRLSRTIDTVVLRTAAAQLARRHPVLRLSFDLGSFSRPLQLVHRAVEVPLTEEDLRGLGPEEQQAAAARRFEEEKRHRFAWERPPLLRFHVQHLSGGETQLFWAMHHVILDGWSGAVLLSELFQLYQAELAGAVPPPAPVSTFRDFIALERAVLESEEARSFWTDRLRDAEPARLLPWHPGKPADGDRAPLSVPLPDAVLAGLRELVSALGVPQKSVFLAAHVWVVGRTTGTRDVITGLVTNGRPEAADGERVLGLFVNTVPLRTTLSGGTWTDLVRQMFEAESELLPFRRFPLAEIQRELGVAQLFEISFNYINFYATAEVEQASGLQLDSVRAFYATNIPLTIDFGQDSVRNVLHLGLQSDSGAVSPDQLRAITDLYLRVLAAIAEAANRRYDTADLLSEAERQQILHEWNDTALERPLVSELVHGVFEHWVATKPDAPALRWSRGELTYRELNRQANRIARRLRASGAGPEVAVGFYVERSPEMIAGLLGIWKAGATYVPLDPAYPRERLLTMIEDVHMPLALAQERLAGGLAGLVGEVIAIGLEPTGPEDDADPQSGVIGVGADNLAYVIFTSGSTGRPKPVGVPHRGLTWHAAGTREVLRMGEYGDARVLHFSTLNFDGSLDQLTIGLHNGCCLVLREEEMWSAEELEDRIAEHELTIVDLSTGYWSEWVRARSAMPEREGGEPVRLVYLGGEAMMSEELSVWWRSPRNRNVRLLNAYGPTETVIVVSALEVTSPESSGPMFERVPIGRPFLERSLHVVDPDWRLSPIGVSGELLISGRHTLARGYLGRPDLTAERFLPDPYSPLPGARLYRTGDLGRYLPDGRREFLGRVDDQVKIRGFRIELGEVEGALMEHSAVYRAVAVTHGKQNDRRLVAYVTFIPGESLAAEELRAFLRGKLPEPLVPSEILILDRLPLTPTGKVDRRALPVPELSARRSAGPLQAPRSDVELQLVGIWEELLEVSPLGVTDDFLELGGHSLLAVRLMARIEHVFGVKLPISALFEAPTVERLAAVLQGREAPLRRSPLVRLHPGGAGRPLFVVHPVGGDVFAYVGLARRLGADRPVYGLQAVVEGNGHQPALEELAAQYLAAVREVQPEGPYLLAGWSLGAVIAYEMAQQIEGSGGSVALLAMIDPSSPEDGRAEGVDDASLLAGFAFDLVRLSGRQVELGREVLEGLEVDAGLDRLVELGRSAGVLPPDVDKPRLRERFDLFGRHVRALQGYVPLPYGGKVTLFRASGSLPPGADLTAGWGTLAGAAPRVLEADHYSLLHPPVLDRLVEQLQSDLTTAERAQALQEPLLSE